MGGTLTTIGAFPSVVKVATEKSGASGKKIRSVDQKGQQLSGSIWDNVKVEGVKLELKEYYCFYYGGGNDRKADEVRIVGLPKKGIGRNQCNGKEKEQRRALNGKSYVEINVEIPLTEHRTSEQNLLVWGVGNPKEDRQALGCIDTKWWRDGGYKDNNGIIVWDSFLKDGDSAECAHRMYVGYVATRMWNNKDSTVKIPGLIGKKWEKVKTNTRQDQESECKKNEQKDYKTCTEKIEKLWTEKWTQKWEEVSGSKDKYRTIGSEKITWTLKQK